MQKQIEAYLNSRDVTALAKSSREMYRYALQHLAEFCKANKITKVDRFQEYMPAFAEYLERKEISGRSVQHYLNCVKIFLRIFGYPVEYTYRISNSERKANKRKALDRWFDESDIKKCLDYRFKQSEPITALRNQVLVRLLIETGARIRELVNVKAKDIDLENNTIWLYESKTEPRAGFFSPDTALIFAHYRKFPGAWKGNIFPKAPTIQGVVTKMLQALGLKSPRDGRGPHTFRHWCATKLFYDGDMRIEDIAILLGDKPETIVKCYLHPTPRMLQRRVVKAMGWEKADEDRDILRLITAGTGEPEDVMT